MCLDAGFGIIDADFAMCLETKICVG